MRTKLRGRPTIRKEQGKKTVQREREREIGTRGEIWHEG